jgi:hypothetical protein
MLSLGSELTLGAIAAGGLRAQAERSPPRLTTRLPS